MKDMVRDKIKQLGEAKESMLHLVNAIEKLEDSQQRMEKDAYESINASDRALNLSKEGKLLIQKISDHLSSSQESQQTCEMKGFLDEVNTILSKIMAAAHISNDKLHVMEHEVASRCKLTDNMKNQVKDVSESLDQVTACAEMLLTMEGM